MICCGMKMASSPTPLWVHTTRCKSCRCDISPHFILLLSHLLGGLCRPVTYIVHIISIPFFGTSNTQTFVFNKKNPNRSKDIQSYNGQYHTVSYVSSWYNENHLNLNAGKTKEMIFDFRKIQNDKAPVIINNTSVKQVPSYKYLGAIIQNNLK